ncbi:MAG: hypothetical protein R3C45_13350 [Phycisphaerales bacterium]
MDIDAFRSQHVRQRVISLIPTLSDPPAWLPAHPARHDRLRGLGQHPRLPRVSGEVDFTGLPFAGTLGSMELERWLHKCGDIFFFHHALDAQPKEFALLGLFATIGFVQCLSAGHVVAYA